MVKQKTSAKSIQKLLVLNYIHLTKDQLIVYPFIISFISIVGAVLYLFFMSSSLPSEVPLYYSLPWGKERLVETAMLLYVPIGSFIIFVIDFVIVFFLGRIEPVLSRMLACASGFVSFLGVYTLVRIILLVT